MNNFLYLFLCLVVAPCALSHSEESGFTKCNSVDEPLLCTDFFEAFDRLSYQLHSVSRQLNELTMRSSTVSRQVSGVSDQIDGVSDQVDGVSDQVTALSAQVDDQTATLLREIRVASGICEAVLVRQLPDQTNGLFSDTQCDICSGGSQTIASPFLVTELTDICHIRIWGAFFPNNVFLGASPFHILIHEDSNGLPGPTVVFDQDGLIPEFEDTTIDLFGVDEYQADFLDLGIQLTPGVYWIQIFADSGSGNDDWFWEADADGDFRAFALEAPGVNWVLESAGVAIEMFGSGASSGELAKLSFPPGPAASASNQTKGGAHSTLFNWD